MTREQMHEYGYLWDGMTPLTEEEAVEAFKSGAGDVFRLYEDDTEGLVESLVEIREHAECGGIFGLGV